MKRNVRIIYTDCCARNEIYTAIDDEKEKNEELDRIFGENGLPAEELTRNCKVQYLD
jgi:hypothetical protein